MTIVNGDDFVAAPVGAGSLVMLQWSGTAVVGPGAGEWQAIGYTPAVVAMGLYEYYVVHPDGSLELVYDPPPTE